MAIVKVKTKKNVVTKDEEKNSKDLSWINCKMDRRIHAQFSMILNYEKKSLKEAMQELVSRYVAEKRHIIMEIIASQ